MGKKKQPRPVFQIKVRFQKSMGDNYLGIIRLPRSLGPIRPVILSNEYALMLEELIGPENPQYIRVGEHKFLDEGWELLPTRDGQRLEDFVQYSLKKENISLTKDEDGREYLQRNK